MIWSGLPAASELPSLVWAGVWAGMIAASLGVLVVIGFRVSRVLNLAIGSAFVLGAFLFGALGGSLPAAVALAVVALVAAAAGAAQERVVLRPLRAKPPFVQLLSTVGIAFAVEGFVIATWGREPVSAPKVLDGQLTVGDVHAQHAQLILVATGLVLAFIAQWWLRRTKSGRQVSATTDDPGAAMMLGIDVDRLRLACFATVSAAAALIGAVAASLVLVDYASGLPLSLEAFVAAVIGGGRSPVAALGGGLLVGLIEAFGGRVFTANIAEVMTFTALIAVVLVARRLPSFQLAETR
ncbi:branched-chain amino acid ABC transporter permease [Actinophytocola sp.]|uniref:branched-chain amino acid ABC transporter permease n=1 Tax=Actinophytocola sp. TaxID=1872138 RepID=UPI003D6B036D